ncbi:hypothetical protein LWI29_021456 [Acer saccharum]|uniref:Uncharacterized protein n=1 Tax=Acer saccharum TaxID=4024 RepID=A0AA39RZQ1_ACESA|nr:hypothetical protein LWI29_021456 [Acer saccharum]
MGSDFRITPLHRIATAMIEFLNRLIKVAVVWVNNGDFGNIAHFKTIYDIRGILKAAGGMKVVFESRIFNSFTDILAKMDSSIAGDFVEWGDI